MIRFIRRYWETHWELLGDLVGLVSLVAFFYIAAILLYAVQP